MATKPSKATEVFGAAGSSANSPSPVKASVHTGPDNRNRCLSTFSVSKKGGVTPAFAASVSRTLEASAGASSDREPPCPSDSITEPSSRYQVTRSISGYLPMKRSTPSSASRSS